MFCFVIQDLREKNREYETQVIRLTHSMEKSEDEVIELRKQLDANKITLHVQDKQIETQDVTIESFMSIQDRRQSIVNSECSNQQSSSSDHDGRDGSESEILNKKDFGHNRGTLGKKQKVLEDKWVDVLYPSVSRRYPEPVESAITYVLHSTT